MKLSNHLLSTISNMSIDEFDYNYDLLGEGSSRIVYGIDNNYVAKVAKNEAGYWQCRIEHYIYTHADNNLKKYLCPVIWSNDRLLVMERTIPLLSFARRKEPSIFNVLGINHSNPFYNDINNIIDNYDLLYNDTISISSWGILKGKYYVLIDYGCTNKLFHDYFR